MPLKKFKPNPFIPSRPRTGDDKAALYRGQNMWIRGSAPDFYAEVYSGSENLNETIPTETLTGTISFTAGGKTISGSGTSFVNKLHIGQFIFSGGELLVVDRVLSGNQFTVQRAPRSSASGQAIYLLPVIFEMDKKRGTLIRGNATLSEQGSILCVGDGILRLNGAVLPGDSLIASRRPRIAKFDPSSGNFKVSELGLTPPTGISATNVAGGVKSMTPGARGIRFVRARTITGKGYGNPSENYIVTLAAGEKIQVTFSDAMDTAQGQDAIIAFCTQYQGSTAFNSAEGPHFETIFISKEMITGPGDGRGTFEFEYSNSEIGSSERLSFNNDPPPDAEYIADLTGYPIYVSCQGEGNAGAPNGTSPGPFIVPAKPNNIEAAPLSKPNPVCTPKAESIIGFATASSRLFLMTANRLNFAAFTGNSAFPVTVRSYYKRGFANPYNLAIIDDYIYSSTTAGFTRTITEGDGTIERYDFSADVKELSKEWTLAHQLVAHDPKNEAVCFFHSAAYKNAAGYWVTVVFPYMLELGFFSMPIVIESNSRDMIVSGVATVNNYLEFLAGGRKSDNTIAVDTFRFDTGSGAPVKWALAWGFSDDGLERNAKTFKGFSLTGKTTNATLGIFAAKSEQEIDVHALETGNSASASGAIPISDESQTSISKWTKRIVREMMLYAPRIEGTWSGNGEKDRIDELVIQVDAGGLRK